MAWITRKEYCEREDIKFRAFKYRKKAGLIQWRYGGSGRGGEAGKHIEVWMGDEAEVKDQKIVKFNPDRYRVNHGEPGANIITPLVDGLPEVTDTGSVQTLPIVGPLNQGRPPAIEGNLSTLPARVNSKLLRRGHLNYAILKTYREEASKNHRPKDKIRESFAEQFNLGLLLPEIHKEIKKISPSTLKAWDYLEREGGPDALIPHYGGAGISKVTTAEKQFLRQFLLNQNHPKIADAIRRCKYYLGEQSPSSPATLRRYVNEFKSEFHDVWTLDREGQKAWNDKDAPYQDRAWWTLEVGEILVADGHKLNFKVINPHTGKESRAVLVMFWDWYSSYPVGWEVMLTENIQCVATALRNAILTLGKIPKCVYLDNGKAFKAKCFTKKIILEETEIPGMFARLGIDVMFAMKYNAQAKPVERIFGVLEWLERQIPSFTGASINDKPANLKPNEDRAKKLRGEWTPKLEQVNDLIRQWRDFYAVQPLRGRNKKTATELFETGRGTGIDPKSLCFLMMRAEVRGVRRGRLTFDGFDWTGECLYGLRQRVIVRYSLSDWRQIFVFDLNDRFIGIVEPVDYAAPRDYAAGKRVTAERRKYFHLTKSISNMAKTGSPEVIDLISRKNPELIEYIQQEEAKKEQPRISPFLPEEAQNAERIAQSENSELRTPNSELDRPWFYDDYEKYDWLMKQPSIGAEDQAWVEDFISRSSLYKHAVEK